MIRPFAGDVATNLYGKGIDEPSEWGHREMDGQACEGSGRDERERTSQILMRTDYTFDPAVTFYPQQDHEGTVTHLTDVNGAVIERYRYDVFGAPTIYPPASASPTPTPRQASIVSNRFLFTGREYAASFGFYEYRARAYHPGLGRFTSEDPKLFDAGDYNLFRYCHNDPLDMTDPMGLKDIYVSPEMDRLGIQASLNSRAASIAARDGLDRSQLIQEKAWQLSLQNRFTVGQDQRDLARRAGTFVYVHSQHEEARPDAGFIGKASGHVHMDKTGKDETGKLAPHSPKSSDTDIATAQGSKGHPGNLIYRANESDPTRVYRLTPQKNPGEPPTEKVLKVRQQQKPPPHKWQDPLTPKL